MDADELPLTTYHLPLVAGHYRLQPLERQEHLRNRTRLRTAPLGLR